MAGASRPKVLGTAIQRRLSLPNERVSISCLWRSDTGSVVNSMLLVLQRALLCFTVRGHLAITFFILRNIRSDNCDVLGSRIILGPFDY